MYTLDLNENTELQLSNIILDSAKKMIPQGLKVFLARKSNRKKMLEKFGDKAFLEPDKLKYPVVDQSGNPHRGLIKAAYMRAKQYGQGDVAAKAKDMMQEHGDESVHINVIGYDDLYEIGMLFDLLELDFATTNDQDYKTVFRGPDNEIIIKPGDKVQWTDDSGNEYRGIVKKLEDNTAIVDVDGEEKTLEV